MATGTTPFSVTFAVVPHAGDVDRNTLTKNPKLQRTEVVPHAGDVDRNIMVMRDSLVNDVVPHAGDVDRNNTTAGERRTLKRSSPTRGTWIEI